jgi:hypothetical protein
MVLLKFRMRRDAIMTILFCLSNTKAFNVTEMVRMDFNTVGLAVRALHQEGSDTQLLKVPLATTAENIIQVRH